MAESRIDQLWEASERVLDGCALDNGARVAANSDLAIYPRTAENYRFVWMRDNAYQIVADHVLGSSTAADRRAGYLDWLTTRAEGFTETGVVIKRYATNGSLDLRYGSEYQPDQAGAMLWALAETDSHQDQQAEGVMRQLANGLASQWNGRNFIRPTQDLWENQTTSPELGDNFVYSLAACASGLTKAAERWQGRTLQTDVWQQTAREMRVILIDEENSRHYDKKTYPIATEDPNNILDASLVALVYPFYDGTNAHDEKTRPKRERTVLEIGKRLCHLPEGILRYEGDTYDGVVRPDGQELTAGRWPLLTFWHAIAMHRLGHTEEAERIYDTQVDYLDELYRDKQLPDNLISEQLFPDERQGQGILPLAWSHAMFVLATRELGIR